MNPKLTFTFISGTLLVLAATALVLKTNSAVAQEAVEEIIVEAPILRRETIRTARGFYSKVTEVKRRVYYADLDLSRHADVIELETRIRSTAQTSCERLNDMSPLQGPYVAKREIRSCTNRAVASAKEQMQAAVAANAS